MGYTNLYKSEPTTVNKYNLKLSSVTEHVVALNVHSATMVGSLFFGSICVMLVNLEIQKKEQVLSFYFGK